MKALRIAAGLALFASMAACHAQSSASCDQALNAPLRSGAILMVDSISSGIEIVATDQEAIRVTCKSDSADSSSDIYLHLSGTPTRTKLAITGESSHHNLQIRLELPRKVNLELQMAAGQVTVREIIGDKKINIRAGQISITLPHTSDYKKIDLSVGVGQVNAPAYGTNRGGFFRSLKKENPEGEYMLEAHVAAGQIDLLSKSSHPDAEPN